MKDARGGHNKDHAKRQCAKCHAILGFGYKLSARLLGCSIGLPRRVKRELGIAPRSQKASWGVLRGREVLGLTAPHHIERLQCEAFEDETRDVLSLENTWGKTQFSNGIWEGHPECGRWRACVAAKVRHHRFKQDPNYIVARRMRFSVWKHIKRMTPFSMRTEELIGCTFEEFKIHIENQFDLGMSWSNHGKWHIDHIRPCSSFNLADPEQAKRCFHYTNLRPLPASENRSKNSRWKGKYIRKPRFQGEMAKNSQNFTNGTLKESTGGGLTRILSNYR